MAQNLSWSAFGKAKELQSRILFALGLLVIYRLGTYLPMPGIDPVQLARFIEQTQSGILGVFNMFAGGAVSRMAIFALGIMPYISATIILQLMTAVVPALERLAREVRVMAVAAGSATAWSSAIFGSEGHTSVSVSGAAATARSDAANSGCHAPSRSSSTVGRTTNMPAFQR